MYSIENFRVFNVRCFSDPRTFFNSELLLIYGIYCSGNRCEINSVLLLLPAQLLICVYVYLY